MEPKQPDLQAPDKRFALLIDADNVSAKYIKPIMAELSKYGTITYKRIYGDWTLTLHAKWKDALLENSITPIQQFSYTYGKNSTDSAMIIDAMDILYTGQVDGFCIVSSDSDFTRLASRLRESGRTVIGMGEKKTPAPFRKACDIFTVLELLVKTERAEKANGPVMSKAEVEQAVVDIIIDNQNNGKATGLGEIGSRLQKRYPDFDVRNYGTNLLSKLLGEFGRVKITKDHSSVAVELVEGAETEKTADAERVEKAEKAEKPGKTDAAESVADSAAVTATEAAEEVAASPEAEQPKERPSRRSRRSRRIRANAEAQKAQAAEAEAAEAQPEPAEPSAEATAADSSPAAEGADAAPATTTAETTEGAEEAPKPARKPRRRRKQKAEETAAEQSVEETAPSEEVAPEADAQDGASAEPAAAPASESAEKLKAKPKRKPRAKAKAEPEARAEEASKEAAEPAAETQPESAGEPAAKPKRKPRAKAKPAPEPEPEPRTPQVLIRERVAAAGEASIALTQLGEDIRAEFKDFKVRDLGFPQLRLYVASIDGFEVFKSGKAYFVRVKD